MKIKVVVLFIATVCGLVGCNSTTTNNSYSQQDKFVPLVKTEVSVENEVESETTYGYELTPEEIIPHGDTADIEDFLPESLVDYESYKSLLYSMNIQSSVEYDLFIYTFDKSGYNDKEALVLEALMFQSGYDTSTEVETVDEFEGLYDNTITKICKIEGAYVIVLYNTENDSAVLYKDKNNLLFEMYN